MAIKEYNVDLDIKGRVLATTVPNSTGSIVTWNSSTNVFGLRTNAQIISDLGLSTVVSNSHSHSNLTVLNGITSTNVNNWNTAFGWGDHSGLYALVGRSIVAGNGLSGGGTLAANRTITLGTPSSIGLTSTNSVTTTSHTHALDATTITAISQGVTAHSWGDFRDFGLGQGQSSVGTWDLSQDYSGFVSASGHGIPGWSTGRAWGFRTSYNSTSYGVALAMRNGRAAFQTRENGTESGWFELWHSGNFDPSQYVLQSALNNYYQSGDVNIPSKGGDYVVFPTNSTASSTFDLDAITGSGFYYQMTNGSNPNSPNNGYWYIENHTYASGNRTQYAHPYRVSDGKWMRSRYSGTWTPWVEFIHSGNLATYANTLLTGFVPTARTITAGNGLSGGGNLTANRTITLGTPSAITLSSTNSVTTSSHTHAFTPGGTTSQYIRGDGSLATMPTFTDAITSISRNGVNIPIVSQNVDIPVFSTTGAGLVPARVGSVATKYLREDGAWVTPTNTTYSTGTLALLQAGTNTTNRVWSAKNLADYVTSMIPTSILSYSSANGIVVTDWNSFALSDKSISLGSGTVTSGNYATSVGSMLSTTGFGSTNQGYSNSITKSLGYSLGAYNSVRATLSGAFGIGLINRNDGAFVVGRYNSELPIEPYDTTSPHKQAVFAIGAGRDETDRFTALTVYGDGRADYAEGYDDSTWTNNTLVTKKWVQDNVGGSSTGGLAGYRNVNEASVFDLSVEYNPSMAENVYHVKTERPVVFIGGSEVFPDGYKVTIMTSDDRVVINLDSSQAVKFRDGEGALVSSVGDSQSITFIYDKEYSLFRVYHVSYTSGI